MKLGEGDWTIKCKTVHAADCAASLLLIITNTSVSFVFFPKKIESSVYFFISTGCFQAMVSAIKIKRFHSFASQPGSSSHTRWITLWALQIRSWTKCGTKWWSKIHRICGSSWKLKFIFTKFYWSVVVFFSALAGDRLLEHFHAAPDKFGWSWTDTTHFKFSDSCFVISTGRNLGFWWWLEELAEIAINPLHCFCLKLPFFLWNVDIICKL